MTKATAACAATQVFLWLAYWAVFINKPRTALSLSAAITTRTKPADCTVWTVESLSRLHLYPSEVLNERWPFERSFGLGYTVAPIECLSGLAWSTAHLHNIMDTHNITFFMHQMKTGGSSLRAVLEMFALQRGEDFCRWYSEEMRTGHVNANRATMVACRNTVHSGHVLQNGHHLRFPEFRDKRAFYFTMMRNPMARALSSYDYWRVSALSQESFFRDGTGSSDDMQNIATFWAIDIFWHLGIDKIRTTDPPLLQLEKMERCKYVIRSILVLISERMLESVALLSAVLGGTPSLSVDCVLPSVNGNGASERSYNMNVTRETMRIAFAKTRHARVLYEYAVQIFELRLAQFGIREALVARCTAEELVAGGFAQLELNYLDANDSVVDVFPDGSI